MKILMNEVEHSILKEYDRASEEYGPVHNSDHEAYAVLLEEFEESLDDVRYCEKEIEEFWKLVKDKTGPDDIKVCRLKTIYAQALYGACELIQTAAMAHKAIRTIEERGKC